MLCQSQIDLEPWTIIRLDLPLPYHRDNLSPTVYGLHQILILENSIGLAQTPLYQSKTVLGNNIYVKRWNEDGTKREKLFDW